MKGQAFFSADVFPAGFADLSVPQYGRGEQGTLCSLDSSKMTSYNSEAPVLDTFQAVVSAYSDFLTVAIHTILYERNIYPQTSFIKARKYNYPVRQSRHPKLCKWIMDAVASVEAEMLKVRKPLECYSVHTLTILSTPSNALLLNTQTISMK